MELFKQPNLDWMGKAKYFYALSGILLLIGAISVVSKGGLRYGIDFKAGTVADVRFAQSVQIEDIRRSLASQGLGDNSQIQKINDPVNPNLNEFVIELEQKGQGDEALDAGKAAILKALNSSFGPGEAKQDFNNISPAALAEFLSKHDPLALGTSAGDRYTQLSRRMTEFRDKDNNGLLTNLDQLQSVSGVTSGVLSTLKSDFGIGQFALRNVEIVGPRVGAQLRRQAIYVTLYALAGMLVYIAFRFQWVYGAAAVLAVFHDVLITLGLFSLFNFEISLTVIAALLTLVGYSMNDTIVIFDRIRENNRLMRREPFPVIVNRSINQTLSRTILTSGLTFLTVLVLFLMGGQVLRAFSFALVVGIIIGTYSSFGIAAPLVVAWNHWRGQHATAGTGTAAGNKPRSSEPQQGRLAAAGRR
ncbi:MAG TPA: protein translocase subunit SecF [Candidatus Dormibacteraeota bacterium]|nr:protein translocase subunit SecF [Candidatus Dormibacteraeota bacterium]